MAYLLADDYNWLQNWLGRWTMKYQESPSVLWDQVDQAYQQVLEGQGVLPRNCTIWWRYSNFWPFLLMLPLFVATSTWSYIPCCIHLKYIWMGATTFVGYLTLVIGSHGINGRSIGRLIFVRTSLVINVEFEAHFTLAMMGPDFIDTNLQRTNIKSQ